MLTSQNNSRTATVPIASDILGEVRWYDDASGQSGELHIHKPQCTIGSNPGCTIALPIANVADIHATLVFGKRFVLLKAPFATFLAGRQVRESLIDRYTELKIGSVLIEVIPKHELGRNPTRPRLVRSQELAERAALLAVSDVAPDRSSVRSETHRETRSESPSEPPPTHDVAYTAPALVAPTSLDSNARSSDLKAHYEEPIVAQERLVAIETTLGQLQSAVEQIQLQNQEPAPQPPVDFSHQLSVMGRSVADELEQRLASRFESQAMSQASLVDQLRNEALRPIESSLEGVLGKLETLSQQQGETAIRLDALAASTGEQFSEWNQWRESLLQQSELDYSDHYQQPPSVGIDPQNYFDPSLEDSDAQGFANPASTPFNPSGVAEHYHAPLTGFPEIPSYRDNYVPEDRGVTAYGQSGFDSQAGFELPYSYNSDQYENESAEDSSSSAYDQQPWSSAHANDLNSWNGEQQNYISDSTYAPYQPAESPEHVGSVDQSYYDNDVPSISPYQAEEPEASASHEIPILTRLENQIASRDYGPSVSDEVQPRSENALGSYLGSDDSTGPSSDSFEENYLANSPLAAFLKNPSAQPNSESSNEALTKYPANLESFLASPQVKDEPATPSPIIRSSLYTTPASNSIESDSSIDDGNEPDELSRPTSELSLRLRQMLAELKAEEEQSTDAVEPYAEQQIAPDQVIPEPIEEPVASARPSWLKDFASSLPADDEDRTMELSNDIGPSNSRFDEPEEDSPFESHAGHESQSLPAYDWSKGSLLASEVESQEHDHPLSNESHSQAIEDEAPQPVRSEIAPSQMRSDNARSESDGSDREESIEEYMQKLLQRVKQGPSDNSESLPEDMLVKAAPRSRREFLNRSTKALEALSTANDLNTSGEFDPESAKRPAPEQVNMGALRELANSNARRAIARSETKRANTTILIKIAITSFAIAAAALILLLNGFRMNPPFAGFVAALVVAYLWGTDCYKHFKALKDEKPTNPVTSAPVLAEESPVRTTDETDGGWRPSPI